MTRAVLALTAVALRDIVLLLTESIGVAKAFREALLCVRYDVVVEQLRRIELGRR